MSAYFPFSHIETALQRLGTRLGSGQLHRVSHTAWYQHLASACTEEECQHIQTARLLGDRIASLPPLTKPSSTPDRDYLVPPSARRADTRQGLAKRARENRDPNEYVGRRKCVHVRVQQPIEQAGPSNYGDQVSIKAFSSILTTILIVSSGSQSFTIPDSDSGERDLYPGIPVLTYDFTFHLMKISFQTGRDWPIDLVDNDNSLQFDDRTLHFSILTHLTPFVYQCSEAPLHLRQRSKTYCHHLCQRSKALRCHLRSKTYHHHLCQRSKMLHHLRHKILQIVCTLRLQ